MVARAGAATSADAHSIHIAVSPAAASRYAAASRADDVDRVLIAVAPLMSAMVKAAGRGASSAPQLDLVQAQGLALSVFHPRPVDDFSDT